MIIFPLIFLFPKKAFFYQPINLPGDYRIQTNVGIFQEHVVIKLIKILTAREDIIYLLKKRDSKIYCDCGIVIVKYTLPTVYYDIHKVIYYL